MDTPTFDAERYWDRRLRHAYDLGAVGHAALGLAANRWAYRLRGEVFERALKPFLSTSPPTRVLDVGSGTGFYLRRWRDLGATVVVGSDITEVAVRQLRKRYPQAAAVRLDIGAETGAPMPGSFDYVSAMDVLFHIVDDDRYRRALRNLATMVRPGGHLVLSEDFIRRGERRAAPHKVSRSMAEIEDCLHAAGLEPLLRRPIFFLLGGPVDARGRLLPAWWSFLTSVLRKRPGAGRVLGPVLYAVDSTLGRALPEGPSTELMVCRRPEAG